MARPSWRSSEGLPETPRSRRTSLFDFCLGPGRSGLAGRVGVVQRAIGRVLRRIRGIPPALEVWGETVAKTIRFDLWLGNTGSSPAEDVDLILTLPDCLNWVAASSSDAAKPLARPAPPKPPEKPIPRNRFDSLGLTRLPIFTPLTGQIERMLAQREEDKVEVNRTADGGFLIHAKLKRLKHGQNRRLGMFFGVFGNWSEVRPFEGEYSVSTSEIPEQINGKVPFIVRRKEIGGP